VVLMLLLLAAAVVAPPTLPLLPPHPKVNVILAPRPPLPAPPDNDAGGGASDPLPARKGKLPDARPARVFIPPSVAVNEHPALPVLVAMTGLPDLDIDLSQFGDPGANSLTGGLGPGPGKGIGPGFGPGIGPGGGEGLKNSFTALKTQVTRPPQLIYKEEPQYSEPARRAHIQGYVRLRIDVALDGKPINIRVIQGIGLGLDECAIDAVKRWRFQPALAGDVPVVAPATIEVGFHLI
jgi:protein TonB